MHIDRSLKKAGDVLLTLLVMAGTLSLAWLGLTGTDSIMTIAGVDDAEETASASPAPAFTVVVDAGHGGFDGGAVGNGGTVESELNLLVAKELENLLLSRGIGVYMTRTDEGAIGETKNEDMQERKRILCTDGVDIAVSIHMNKFRDSTVSGPMVFYMKGSTEGKQLADCVMGALCERTCRTPRQSNPEDLFVLRVPKAPSVLVECGFLSNPDDEALLQTEEYRSTIALGICEGILNYKAQKELGDT